MKILKRKHKREMSFRLVITIVASLIVALEATHLLCPAGTIY